ncbi:DUF1987 domain-containing protein [Fulvivirga sp. RKSG066]|uniref:DUF1987 domain-containing protein n=1 Tax=Fulvivirga aurantia TaxID=2529383 RepID=UPI0012BD0AD0|nr:DUF1987 domain-containing protein [Fulvivirga aurantia]MTI20057.1 DUF1987 domain-containing protein [Fulvivirga aurantia]
MKTLLLEPTEDSPLVKLDPAKGHMLITGRSYMVDASTYLKAMTDWFRNYMVNPQPRNIIELEFEYLNSSSHSMLIYLLEEINKYHIMGHNFEVIWRYHEDDEYLQDIGQELQESFDLPIVEQVLV